jgi:hypothetical protein
MVARRGRSDQLARYRSRNIQHISHRVADYRELAAAVTGLISDEKYTHKARAIGQGSYHETSKNTLAPTPVGQNNSHYYGFTFTLDK